MQEWNRQRIGFSRDCGFPENSEVKAQEGSCGWMQRKGSVICQEFKLGKEGGEDLWEGSGTEKLQEQATVGPLEPRY